MRNKISNIWLYCNHKSVVVGFRNKDCWYKHLLSLSLHVLFASRSLKKKLYYFELLPFYKFRRCLNEIFFIFHYYSTNYWYSIFSRKLKQIKLSIYIFDQTLNECTFKAKYDRSLALFLDTLYSFYQRKH